MEEASKVRLEKVAEAQEAESRIVRQDIRRKQVRKLADDTIQEWLRSEEGKAEKEARKRTVHAATADPEDDLSLASEETPSVFSRASSARELLSDLKGTGQIAESELRELSLAQLTAQQAGSEKAEPVVDEDTLSLNSFIPGKEDSNSTFDRKKRTVLERLFAIDKQVRKGQLKKHVKWQKLEAVAEEQGRERDAQGLPKHSSFKVVKSSGRRALVIEGAALKHLLGHPEMEEILFAVASQCEAVIACRVSPQQKALLVNLVRNNVVPEPITLAIGDGANDVGMIQEAHVGIGVSGKEGQQAVNASDFAIAQFRFLETLIL